MADLGFEKLTRDNWLKANAVSAKFVNSSSDGKISHTEADDWLKEILKPQLLEIVPENVQALFEVARGVLAYGYFFYPLYALGAEQLVRVAEAAVTEKCRAIGLSEKVKIFDQQLDYLVRQQIISEQDKEAWKAIHLFRNAASHPKQQTIITPPMAIKHLQYIADKINSVFSGN